MRLLVVYVVYVCKLKYQADVCCYDQPVLKAVLLSVILSNIIHLNDLHCECIGVNCAQVLAEIR